MHPKDFKIKDFSYDLPENRIAKYPLQERDASKLLIYRDKSITEDIYRNIDTYIPENALLVFNKTKVIQARLHFKNTTGATIEIFCLEPGKKNAEPASAMSQKKSVEWLCLVGNLARWKEGKIILTSENFSLHAEIIEQQGGTCNIRFSWQPEHYTFAEILEQAGEMPIPPYLKREAEAIDTARYQTVYAEQKGSVAAPTAGLHFTEQIVEKLRSKGTIMEYVTLHVGAGTFKPVQSATLEGHAMHFEWIAVEIKTIEQLIKQIAQRASGKSIIAVGTTSLRTIESLYWMGVKANTNPEYTLHELEIKQWDAYALQQDLNALDAFHALLQWLKKNHTEKLFCRTQLLIVPSYQLKIAGALITNFHQPRSTLLLLVAAIAGDDWKMIYEYALAYDFRFLSYGDGSLLFKK